MRSFKVSVVLSALLLIMTPQPAHAWFGWLDYLSGPGPFSGEEYELRLWCFGDKFGTVTTLQDLLTTAVARTLLVGLVNPPNKDQQEQAARRAKNAWLSLVDELAIINGDLRPEPQQSASPVFRVLDTNQIQELRSHVTNLTVEDFTDFNGLLILSQERSAGARASADLRSPPRGPLGLQLGAVTTVIEQANLSIDRVYKGNISRNSTGVFWSFCSPDQTRKHWAVELGATFWSADSNPDFAHTYNIRLLTIMPSVSYRVFPDARYDVIDAGVSAGRYRFSSGGFNTFTGWVLEPYLDLHGPTRWVNDCGFKQLAALLTLRFGLIDFPGGFDTGPQFGAETNTHIRGSKLTKTATVFFNVPPLARHRKPTL
jgi:hypothetical protein